MIFTRRGLFVVHRDGSRRRTAEPMHVLFFNAGESHRVSHPADGGDMCTVLDFPEAIAREASRKHNRAAWSDRSLPFPAPLARATPAAVLELHGLRQHARAGADPLGVEERALALLDLVLRDTPMAPPRERRGDRSRSSRELVDEVVRQIALAPDRKHTLAALAASLSISPYHLARTFRAVTGCTIHRHVVRARLTLALDRLADSSLTLSQIAADVGFSSHGHLTSAFRQVFGLAPSTLRRRWRELSPVHPARDVSLRQGWLQRLVAARHR